MSNKTPRATAPDIEEVRQHWLDSAPCRELWHQIRRCDTVEDILFFVKHHQKYHPEEWE